MKRLGAAGVGVAAGTIIAGCGGSSNNGSANASGVGPINLSKDFQDVQTDENDHVKFLIAAISGAGGTPRPRPQFDPALLTASSASDFQAKTAALENTGTGAYPYVITYSAFAGAGGQGYLQAAATIAIVEGRHAGFANALQGRVLLTDPRTGDTTGPTDTNSREVIQAPSEVLMRATPFLGTINAGSPAGGSGTVGTPGTTYLNGGPGLISDSPTDPANTLALVFNYALLLEYLERDFYNINVAKFYGAAPGAPAFSITGP